MNADKMLHACTCSSACIRGSILPLSVTAALRTTGLHKSFGSLVVAHDIEITLPQGARYALIGPNGAGKTTLINLITGVLRPDAGQILLGERRHHRARAGRARQARARAHVPDQHAVSRSEPLEAVTLAVCERRGVAGAWWRRLTGYRHAVRRGLRDSDLAQARRGLLPRDARARLRPAAAAGDRAGAGDAAEGAAARRARRRRAARGRAASCSRRSPACRGHHGAVHRARHGAGVSVRQPHHRHGRRAHPARGHARGDRRRPARARGLSRPAHHG